MDIDGIVIDQGIAVIVETITEFRGSRVDGRVVVVAVVLVCDMVGWWAAGSDDGVSISKRVPIVVWAPVYGCGEVEPRIVIVSQIVAVIVLVVTDFGCRWVDGRVIVVAVAVVCGVSRRLRACLNTVGRVSEKIAIIVSKVGRGVNGVVIDSTTAVVVLVVTDFGGSGVDRRVRVVAVTIVVNGVWRLITG